MGTSGCFSHRPDSDQRLAPGSSAPFATFWSWKVLQFSFTFSAIHTSLGLGAVPKATASLANFQMHAQFHDVFSVFPFSPDGFALTSCFRGAGKTGQICSGFLRPDGGSPPVFSRFLSCSWSWRADSGISMVGRLWTPLQSVLGRGGDSRKRFSSPGNCSLTAGWGKKRLFQPDGYDTFLQRFPQVSIGLSKANLDNWFLYVNLLPLTTSFALFIPS